MKKKKVVDLEWAKGRGEYAKVISEIADKGKCPFCPDNLIYHRKPILKKHKGWYVTEATWPYKNTKFHFILLGEKHKENITQLKNKDWEAISYLIRWTIKTYKLKGGAMNMRFGETAYTGATVCHIHTHLIVPKLNKKTKRAQVVNFPIG